MVDFANDTATAMNNFDGALCRGQLGRKGRFEGCGVYLVPIIWTAKFIGRDSKFSRNYLPLARRLALNLDVRSSNIRALVLRAAKSFTWRPSPNPRQRYTAPSVFS